MGLEEKVGFSLLQCGLEFKNGYILSDCFCSKGCITLMYRLGKSYFICQLLEVAVMAACHFALYVFIFFTCRKCRICFTNNVLVIIFCPFCSEHRLVLLQLAQKCYALFRIVILTPRV